MTEWGTRTLQRERMAVEEAAADGCDGCQRGQDEHGARGHAASVASALLPVKMSENDGCAPRNEPPWENLSPPMATYVYDFTEGADLGRELLGGKGAGLAEMTAIGVPVPAGFTVTTAACGEYMQNGRQVPAGLDDEIGEHLERLEDATGKRFGDAENPLLVSVRSGAAVSMPGMMDTILNLGLNDEAAAGLARATGKERFAYDAYRRLIQMYGNVVEGIDANAFEEALTSLKEERGAREDVDLTHDDLEQLVETFKGIYERETG